MLALQTIARSYQNNLVSCTDNIHSPVSSLVADGTSICHADPGSHLGNSCRSAVHLYRPAIRTGKVQSNLTEPRIAADITGT